MPVEPASPLAPASASATACRAACAVIAVGAALFCVAVSALLLLNQARFEQDDPLNTPGLTELRQRFATAPQDEALKEAIRLDDCRARQRYFAHQSRARTGGWLLLGGALTLLASLAALPLLRDDEPDVARLGTERAGWDRRRAAWRGLAVGAILLLAATAVAVGFAWRHAADDSKPTPKPTPSRES